MKGVVFTSKRQILATPSPAELINFFNHSPKVGLHFGKIFDFEEGDKSASQPELEEGEGESEG